jgi:hypothetical protein
MDNRFSKPLDKLPSPAANMICFWGLDSVRWKYFVEGLEGLPMIYP